MADFVSSLTGVQMDSALMDMAEHNSEAWAVGQRNGSPVTSDDVTYHNNAQYYAQQAQSIAPASVTEAVRWDIAQTALTDANKAQARENIDAGENGAWSNRNLLDNAYFVGGGSQLGDGIFPINQRGQTSYSSVGYGIDRWRGETGYASVALATDGLKFCSSTSGQWGTLVQLVASAKYLAGETVTISAIIDGTLIYTTYTLPSSGSYDLTAVNVNGIYINLYSPDGVNIQFRIYTQETTQHTIKAAKLEKGTVSTLANDVPPDFRDELRKCQRYLYIIKGAPYTIFAPSAIAENTNYVVGLVPLPVPMRAAPSVAVSGSFRLWGGIGYEYAVAGIIRYDAVQVSINCTSVGLQVSTSGTLTIGNRYDLQANNDINTSLIFSAEL